MVQVVTYDGYFEFSLGANETIYCNWFNIPRPQTGALVVGVSVCPPLEAIPFPFEYATAGASDIASVCSIYRDGPVHFSLSRLADGVTSFRSTDPATGGAATWAQAPTSSVSLNSAAWAGYGPPRVFCSYSNDPARIFEATVQGWIVSPSESAWTASFTTSAGATTVCDWFNIPTPVDGPGPDPDDDIDTDAEDGREPDRDQNLDADAEDGAGADPEDGGTAGAKDGARSDIVRGGLIRITTWVCLAGDELATLSLDELSASCDEIPRNVDFLLSGAGSGWRDETDGDGRVAFGPLATGDYRLSEALTEGDSEPIVYCRLSVGAGALSYETLSKRVAVGGQHETGIVLAIEAGWTWHCDWFTPLDGGPAKAGKHSQSILGHTTDAMARRVQLIA